MLILEIPGYYEDPSTFRVGTQPDRAYYIPFTDAAKALGASREQSDEFISLDGDWRFRYFEDVESVDGGFISPDFDCRGFGTLPVPSVWQMHGFDRHQYTNINYPIPFDPPYVPAKVPCGAYIRDFDSEKSGDTREFLNFEGVDSCIYVYINGRFVGYSQVSNSHVECDTWLYPTNLPFI